MNGAPRRGVGVDVRHDAPGCVCPPNLRTIFIDGIHNPNPCRIQALSPATESGDGVQLKINKQIPTLPNAQRTLALPTAQRMADSCERQKTNRQTLQDRSARNLPAKTSQRRVRPTQRRQYFPRRNTTGTGTDLWGAENSSLLANPHSSSQNAKSSRTFLDTHSIAPRPPLPNETQVAFCPPPSLNNSYSL